MKKRKIIHISPPSYPLKILNTRFFSYEYITMPWSSLYALNTMRRTKLYDIEVWRPERECRSIFACTIQGVLFKIFPGLCMEGLGSFSLPMISELKKEARINEILLHLHGIFVPETFYLSALFKKFPIVAKQHGDTPFHMQYWGKRKTKYPLYMLQSFLEEKYLKYIDFFFVNSRKEIRFLEKYVDNIKNRAEIQQVGINTDIFKPGDKVSSRQMLGLPTDKKIILTVCALSERKGVHLLLKALPAIVREIPDIMFVHVGYNKGSYAQKLEDLIERLNMRNFVKFLGSLELNLLVLAYQSADVFLLPSLHEGAPVVIEEALSCGIPVIATNVGGISEMISDKDGLIIKPGSVSEIKEAVITFFTRKNLFMIDRNKIQKFGWDYIIKRNVEVYSWLFEKYYG